MTGGKDRTAVLTEVTLILAAVFWGLNFAATKFAALSRHPLLLVASRFCVGGMLMYGVLRLLEPRSTLGREAVLPWRPWVASGWSPPRPTLPSA